MNQQPQTKPKKEFFLSSWAIENKMTVFVIMTIILLAGTYSYISMPREAFPEIIENKIYISSVFPGNSSEDVEKLITIPIEDEIRNISGVTDIKSNSQQDYSMIIVELSEDYTIDQALQKVKDKVDIAKAEGDWPVMDNGAKVDPYVFDLNIAEEVPIININITGNQPLDKLKEYAEIFEDDIEELDEIKDVSIVGVDDKEVEVAIDLAKLSASQASFMDVVQAISNDNKTISGGTITEGSQRTNLRVVGEISHPSELENIAIKTHNGVVYVKDVATVSFDFKEPTTYARNYSKPVVMLNVKKRSGKNMIDAVDKIKEKVQKIQEEKIPKNVTVELTGDQSIQTQNQVDDLINNIIFGVILVVGVLLFFLGFKNASFVGIAIPLSMLMALSIAQILGYTMNTMVLFAMVMGLGMLVDNGIVVVENVYTLMDQGLPKKVAAKQGIGEIAWPIIASTATTLAAFFPLGLWPGTMGKFMIYFPLTLSFVLGSSLFIALIINAMLTSEYMSVGDKNVTRKYVIKNALIFGILGVLLVIIGFVFKDEPISKVLIGAGNLSITLVVMLFIFKYLLYPGSDHFQKVVMPKVEAFYEKNLNFFLRKFNPYWVFIGTIVLFFLSIVALNIYSPKTEFFPENQAQQVMVYIEYPEGTDIEKTNATTKEIEKIVIEVVNSYTYEKDGKPYNYMVESVVSQVGVGANNPNTDAGSEAEIPQKGKVTVSFREMNLRKDDQGNKHSSNDIRKEISDALVNFQGPKIFVEKNLVGPPRGYPISIQLSGEDYSQLLHEGNKMIAYINTLHVEGIEELNLDANKDVSELILDVDKELAGSMNVNTSNLGQTLRGSLFGLEASTYKENGEDYDIVVRGQEADRDNRQLLLNQNVTFRNQANGQLVQVPISAVAQFHESKTFSKIKREDYNRVITVYSNVLEGYNGNDIVTNLKKELNSYTLPDGVTYKFTGEQEEMGKNMSFLLMALLLAVAGITLIMVAQFNSISKPIIIMLAVLLSFTGVFFGMIIQQMTFVIIMTMMGVISLAGIMVNNAIVLIDYTELLIGRRKEELGLDKDAWLGKEEIKKQIVAAGKSRLRPVLLTAITTVLGLIPLAIGLNINFFTLYTEYNPNIFIGGENVIFWGPLAKTVINGLIFATFLTLIIIPVLYYFIVLIKERRHRKKIQTS